MFWSDKLRLSITYAARLPAGDSTKFGDQVSSDTKCLCILPCFLAIILSFYWYTCLIGFAHFIWWHDTGVIMSVCLRDLADVSYYGARSCLLFMCVCLIHQCHSQTPKLVTCFPIFCAAKALSNAVKQNWRISAWNGSFQNLSEFLFVLYRWLCWPDIWPKVKPHDGWQGTKKIKPDRPFKSSNNAEARTNNLPWKQWNDRAPHDVDWNYCALYL